MLNNALRLPLLLALFALILSACEQTSSLNETYEKARKKIEEFTPSSDEVSESTQAEIEKLSTIEYKVHTISLTEEPTAIEEQLSALGKERWRCFHTEKRKEDLLFFCSRRPKTYLRYFTRFLHVPES